MSATRFSELPADARSLWAKTEKESDQRHGVLAHWLDIAAVARTILQREPESTRRWAAEAFGLSKEQVLAWVPALCGLHDFGKATPGFQHKSPPGEAADIAAGLSFPANAIKQGNHALATAALLGPLLAQLCDADVSWLKNVLQAISAHHGFNFVQGEINGGKPFDEPRSWQDARRLLLQIYWSVLAPKENPRLEFLTQPAVQWLAGLTSVADWIGSNSEWFPLGERVDDLVDYFDDAKRRAENALDAIGWRPWQPLLDNTSDSTARLLARMLHSDTDIAPRPLQLIGETLLANSQGPSLLLVEAPMGEGKTELAYLAHLRLQAANRHRGLYLALPTQATGNALLERTREFLDAFPGDTPVDLQLVHGGTALNETVAHLRNIFGSPDENVTASAWFSQRKRPLLSAYGVGTVDQALFGVLNVKHHFVRLWGLANRVVVLDEVHAYDTYTSGLIEVLLRWLKTLGSSVVLMSATLPTERRNKLLAAWGIAENEVPSLNYPRLYRADAQGVEGAHFQSRELPSIHVDGIAEDIDSILACAQRELAHGGCGAIIVNTVDRAQSLYRRLRTTLDDDIPVLLFHARYPADTRRRRELEVLGMFGKEKPRPAKALLIATQVAEQSLDIDFDFMISDLAPVDLILQRAGRLHRHDETVRPNYHRQARLWIAGLQSERPPALIESEWSFYDPYILSRTWAWLSRETCLSLPLDIDRLVQLVYGGEELPPELPSAVGVRIGRNHFGKHLAICDDQRKKSLHIALYPEAEPGGAYSDKPRGNEEDGDGLDIKNQTRLGSDSLALVPIHQVAGGFSLEPGGEPFSLDKPIADQLAQRLAARQLNLSRKAVVHHFKGMPTPLAFEKHPLLRHLKPIPLQDGAYTISEALRIRLDDQLGVVYEKEGA